MSLLTLPAELQVKIYDYYYHGDVGCRAITSRKVPEYVCNLWAICRLIHNEARPGAQRKVVSGNTITFPSPQGLHSLQTAPPEIPRLVTKAQIAEFNGLGMDRGLYPHLHCFLASFLVHLPSLQHLTICFEMTAKSPNLDGHLPWWDDTERQRHCRAKAGAVMQVLPRLQTGLTLQVAGQTHWVYKNDPDMVGWNEIVSIGRARFLLTVTKRHDGMWTEKSLEDVVEVEYWAGPVDVLHHRRFERIRSSGSADVTSCAGS